MKKAFQKLQTVVTINFAWTATCRFSDIVLPACTQFERIEEGAWYGPLNEKIDSIDTYSDPNTLTMNIPTFICHLKVKNHQNVL